jgi:hypothetical protein
MTGAVQSGSYPAPTLTKKRESVITYRHSADKRFKNATTAVPKVTDL